MECKISLNIIGIIRNYTVKILLNVNKWTKMFKWILKLIKKYMNLTIFLKHKKYVFFIKDKKTFSQRHEK